MITRNFFVCLFLIIGKIIKSVPGKLMKEVSLPGCQCFNFNNYFHVLTNLEASKKFVWKLSFGVGWVWFFFFNSIVTQVMGHLCLISERSAFGTIHHEFYQFL